MGNISGKWNGQGKLNMQYDGRSVCVSYMIQDITKQKEIYVSELLAECMNRLR